MQVFGLPHPGYAAIAAKPSSGVAAVSKDDGAGEGIAFSGFRGVLGRRPRKSPARAGLLSATKLSHKIRLTRGHKVKTLWGRHGDLPHVH
jgi:hypothetical protein